MTLTLTNWSESNVHNHKNDAQVLCNLLNSRRGGSLLLPKLGIRERFALRKLNRQPGVIRHLPVGR